MTYPSLLRRLILSQALFMGLAYLVAMGWMAYAMLASGNGDLDRRMAYFAQRLADAASADPDDPPALSRRMRMAEKTFIDGFAAVDGTPSYTPVYQVWSRDGRLLYRSASAPDLEMAGAPGVFGTREFAQQRWQTVAVASSDGRLAVHIAERWSDRWETNWRAIQDVGSIQLLAFLFCALAMWLTARRGFAPLRALAAQLSAQQPGEQAPLHADRLYSETAPIVEELNALLTRESRRLDTERSFLADAAHELRTPLASINTLAHLVVVADDDSARRTAAEALQQGMDRVSHLLAQLLAIARTDAAAQVARIEDLEVTTLTRERLAHFATVARARGIDLTFEAPGPLRCRADKGGFVSLLDNLVDNAIRYTSPGGHVLVTLTRTADDAIELRVCDDGPGIPPAEQERVFDRFYRLPGTVALGSGLGLSIVKKVAASHSATVSFVEGLFGRGLGVRVLLPQGRSGA
jgi:signal transduction histidine kinase